jgi:hypothetical protein
VSEAKQDAQQSQALFAKLGIGDHHREITGGWNPMLQRFEQRVKSDRWRRVSPVGKKESARGEAGPICQI